MHLTVLLVAFILLFGPGVASADVMPVTPEVIGRITAMAKAARAKHPTDPTAALNAFSMEFNGSFGDIAPINLEVSTDKDLGIRFVTPILATATAFHAALANLEPLPDKAPSDDVVLYVTPKTMMAPSITRIIVFHGDEQVAALSSALEPKEYQNRLGAKTAIAAGHLTFPASIFDGSKPVKVLCYASGGLFKEWSLTAAWAKEVK